MNTEIKKRTKRDYGSYVWAGCIWLAGLFIVGVMALSMEGKPTQQQTQVADTVVKLLKEPSTTGTGWSIPSNTPPDRVK
jgi:hypothetical protein